MLKQHLATKQVLYFRGLHKFFKRLVSFTDFFEIPTLRKLRKGGPWVKQRIQGTATPTISLWGSAVLKLSGTWEETK